MKSKSKKLIKRSNYILVRFCNFSRLYLLDMYIIPNYSKYPVYFTVSRSYSLKYQAL